MLLLVLAGVASLGFFMAVKGLVERDPADVSALVTERLQTHLGHAPVTLRDIEMQQPFSERVLRPLLERASRLLDGRTPTKQREALEARINLAGLAGSLEPGTFMVVRYAAAAGALLLGLIVGSTVLGTAQMTLAAAGGGALLGYILPMSWLKRKASARTKEVRRQLPDILDLLTITVQAGLTFDAAMARVAEKYRDSALGEEFGQVLQEIRLGKPRFEALQSMSDRSGLEDVDKFVQAVIQSEQMGIGIGKILKLQSEEIRRNRMQFAKAKAARATLFMLLPMVGCIFPVLFMILLGPAALTLLKQFSGGGL